MTDPAAGRAERTLSHAEAKAVYDRFGARQDRQAFYERPALDRLVAHGRFADARAVVELGCGTGAFAERLLAHELPPAASYLGVDLSPTMVELARRRIARFGGRARVVRSGGEPRLPAADDSADRFVTNYVLDLLSHGDVAAVLAEARRVLGADGLLCVTGLTEGDGPLSGAVSSLWRWVHRLSPRLVGGCRPLRVAPLVETAGWRIVHAATVTGWAVPSEVVVASPGSPPTG